MNLTDRWASQQQVPVANQVAGYQPAITLPHIVASRKQEPTEAGYRLKVSPQAPPALSFGKATEKAGMASVVYTA